MKGRTWVSLSGLSLKYNEWRSITNQLKLRGFNISDVGYHGRADVPSPGHHTFTIPESELDDIKKELSSEIITPDGKRYLHLADFIEPDDRFSNFIEDGNEFSPAYVDRVNNVIRKSFGLFYRGNTHIIRAFDGFRDIVGHLEVISRPAFPFDPQFGFGVAGSLNDDGSRIKVRPGNRLLKKAKKYAALYEREFGDGRKVEIMQTGNFF